MGWSGARGEAAVLLLLSCCLLSDWPKLSLGLCSVPCRHIALNQSQTLPWTPGRSLCSCCEWKFLMRGIWRSFAGLFLKRGQEHSRTFDCPSPSSGGSFRWDGGSLHGPFHPGGPAHGMAALFLRLRWAGEIVRCLPGGQVVKMQFEKIKAVS